MENVFAGLRSYGGKWEVQESRAFNEDEKKFIKGAKVVNSDYGLSVCFTMINGRTSFIPLSNTSNKSVGDTINLDKASLLTLSREGDSDVLRVEA